MADKKEKRKHETLNLAKKIEILRKIDRGESRTNLIKEYNIGRATIYDIQQNREKIEKFCRQAGDIAQTRQTLRHCEYKLMEEVLFSWFTEKKRENVLLTEDTVKKQSLHFYKEIYKNDNFKASSGWFRNFKRRYGIKGLHEPLTNKEPTNTEPNSSERNDNKDLSSSKTELKSDNWIIVQQKIEPEEEEYDETDWSDHTMQDTSSNNQKIDEEFGEEDLPEEEISDSLFVSNLKIRMDNLDHSQRFMAQKLISDVLMMAEAGHLQLTSAIVNRPLNQKRSASGRDPLKL